MKDYIVKEVEQRISSFQQLPYLFVGMGFSMRYSHAPSWNTLLFDIWTVINPTKKERDFNKLKQKIEMDIASTKPDLNAEEQKLKDNASPLFIPNAKFVISPYSAETAPICASA